MSALFIGLYGIYFLMVGLNGNYKEVTEALGEDTPGYMVWLFVIIVLAALYSTNSTKDMVKPFIVLLVLNFVLRNFTTIRNELNTIVQM